MHFSKALEYHFWHTARSTHFLFHIEISVAFFTRTGRADFYFNHDSHVRTWALLGSVGDYTWTFSRELRPASGRIYTSKSIE